MNPQKISDIWKALRKIYQMRPTIGIFSNFCRSYKQNKGIHAILEKVQQPVLHHGKKMRFIKKAPYRFFCNLLQWIYTSNGHVKLQKKSQLFQNEHEGMDSEQCLPHISVSSVYQHLSRIAMSFPYINVSSVYQRLFGTSMSLLQISISSVHQRLFCRSATLPQISNSSVDQRLFHTSMSFWYISVSLVHQRLFRKSASLL